LTGRGDLGRLGEEAAIGHLKRSGYRIIARNVRNSYGELDAVAVEGGEIAFVEIRTRTDENLGSPEESMTPSKRAHIIRAALAWLQSKDWEDQPMRFDFVGVQFGADGEPEFNLIRSAFTGDDARWSR